MKVSRSSLHRWNAQVLRIAVAEGATVAVGDDVAVLSAMKTEIAVHATVAGTVERIVCKVGDVVAAGAPMLVVRPSENAR